MRAAILLNIGDEKLEVVDDVEALPPGPGEVTVKIEATGVCHSDLSAMNGTLPTRAPCVLGHEGAGIISAVGEGVDTVAEGDHVIVAWSPPCGRCINCTGRKSPHLCTEIQFGSAFQPRFTRNGEPLLGMAGTGTFAEYLTIPVEGAVKIDADVPFEIASLIGCGVTTGVGAAINTAKVQPGLERRRLRLRRRRHRRHPGRQDRRRGAHRRRRPRTRQARAGQAARRHPRVLPDDLDALKAELTGDGFDYAFEAIGHPVTMRAAFDAVRRGGTACIVGVGKDGPGGDLQRLRAVLRREDVRGLATTAPPTSAPTSPGGSACGRPASSTSRA